MALGAASQVVGVSVERGPVAGVLVLGGYGLFSISGMGTLRAFVGGAGQAAENPAVETQTVGAPVEKASFEPLPTQMPDIVQ